MENNNSDAAARTSVATTTTDVQQLQHAIRPMLLEPRPFRPFKSSEEYLYAMKEDLADWLTTLYSLDIQADNFLEVLETGVVLCRHANNVRKMALEYQQSGRNGLTYPIPDREVTFRTDVVPCTFQARDNVSNFISWCRALGIYECLLFETDDLVLRKNEKSFILCLLEVARRGSKVGMLAPLLVQMEEEIDREIAKENAKRDRATMVDCGTSPDDDYDLSSSSDEEQKSPPPQIITNDLKSLDEMVRDLVNRCTCPLQFPMIRVSEGKYRIGDTKILIYVRILRSHVMVRVGGGWDTLEHYLDKHDPCRCRQGHRAALSSKLTVKFGVNSPAQTQMEVTYQRSPIPISPPSHASPFVPTSNRHRSISPMPPPPPPPPPPNTSPPRQRRSSTSSISSSTHKLSNGSLTSLSGDKHGGNATTTGSSEHAVEGTGVTLSKVPSASPCDSSSEYSDDGYKSGSRIPTLLKSKKYSPKKLLKLTENGTTESEDQNDSPRDSLLGEEEYDEEDPGKNNRFDTIDIKDAATLHHPANIPKCPSKKAQLSPTDEHRSVRPAVNVRTRRLSGETFPSTGRRIPRSRSQSNEVGDTSLAFVRNQGGRHSYRTTRVPTFADGYGALPSSGRYGSATSSDRNHTWTCRPRSSRRSLSPDLFGGRSPPTVSPQRTTASRSPPIKSRPTVPRSLQTSPSKHYAPLLQQMLADSKLDSDDKVLRRMASILQQRKTLASSRHNMEGEQQQQKHFVPHYHSMDDPCCGWTTPTSTNHNQQPMVEPYSRKRHSSSGASQGISSPDSGSDIGLESRLQLQLIPTTQIKISPRKDNHPQTESKIPVPTFY